MSAALMSGLISGGTTALIRVMLGRDILIEPIGRSEQPRSVCAAAGMLERGKIFHTKGNANYETKEKIANQY